MTTFALYNIIGVAAALGATFLALRANSTSSVLAYIALIMFFLGDTIWLDNSSIIVWGIIACAVFIIDISRPGEGGDKEAKHAPFSTLSAVYMFVGSLVLALVAYAADSHFIVPGAVVGAFLALLAYVKTPQGTAIPFPGSEFFHYFCTYALRIILTATIIAMVIGVAATRHIIMQQLHEF